jgi:hypothetical protein
MKVGVLIVGTAALFTAGAPQEILFAPADGLALVKTFEVVSEMDAETSSEHGGSTSSSNSERKLVVTDRVISAEDGRILRLERTYEEVASEGENYVEFGDQSHESSQSGSSEIEGATVAFEWDEDEEEYLTESDDVSDDALEELLFDLDFTLLLPDGDVEEGDEWSLDPDGYRSVMDVWEGLPWEYENSDGETTSSSDEEGGDVPEPETDESEDGELVVTFTGTRDEDGVTVAVLSLSGEIEADRTMDMTHEFEQGSTEVHSETSESREISGEALWNLESGHLLSLVIEVELSASGTSDNTTVFGDQEFEMESEMQRDGTITLTVSFAPEDEE